MIGKTPKEHQMSIFEVALESFIDMNHELVLLSKQIDWEAVESEFAEYYCADKGHPSVPIRKMAGVIGNFACTFFGKGKWTFFRKVKCTS